MPVNPIVPTVPFDLPGKNHGYLRLPYSRDDSAWGSVMIPYCVIGNGKGPTALLTGANHGDEYEGPIALQELALSLENSDISGRVILFPAFNYPAFRTGTRTSPIDHGNMNRSFPGKPDGTVTEKIADFFNTTLIPQADIILDFHSGGRTLDFIPFASAHVLDDKRQQAECVAAVEAFNAPYSMMLLEIDNIGMYDSAAEMQGKVFVTTELGGGGGATVRSISIASKGVRNILKHFGIMKGPLQIDPTTWLDMPDGDCFVFSDDDGLYEPTVDLGQPVEEGETIARIWPVDRTGQAPVAYPARRSGVLASRHYPGLAKSGDCLAVVAVPLE